MKICGANVNLKKLIWLILLVCLGICIPVTTFAQSRNTSEYKIIEADTTTPCSVSIPINRKAVEVFCYIRYNAGYLFWLRSSGDKESGYVKYNYGIIDYNVSGTVYKNTRIYDYSDFDNLDYAGQDVGDLDALIIKNEGVVIENAENAVVEENCSSGSISWNGGIVKENKGYIGACETTSIVEKNLGTVNGGTIGGTTGVVKYNYIGGVVQEYYGTVEHNFGTVNGRGPEDYNKATIKNNYYGYDNTPSTSNANIENSYYEVRFLDQYNNKVIQDDRYRNGKLSINGKLFSIERTTAPAVSPCETYTYYHDDGDTITITAIDGGCFSVTEGNVLSGTQNNEGRYTQATIKTDSKVKVEFYPHYHNDGCTSFGSDSQIWTSWALSNSLPTEPGYYCLAYDVTLSSSWSPADNVHICLNGHVIKAGGGVVMQIPSNYKFTLTDCNSASEHYFKYSKTEQWTLIEKPTDAQKASADSIETIDDETTVVKVFGGCITGGNNNGNSGGCIRLCSGAEFTMYEGNIVGNRTIYSGAGIYAFDNSKLIFKGGSIIGNCTTGYKNEGKYGSHFGGGVACNSSNVAIQLDGDIRISDNVCCNNTVGTKDENLLILSGQLISVSESFSGKAGILTQTAPTDSSPVIFTGTNTKDFTDQFSSDDGNYVVVRHNNCLAISSGDVVCALDGKSYISIAKAIAAAGESKATITIKKSVSDSITIPNGKNIVLDLYTYTVSAKSEAFSSSPVLTNNGTLEIIGLISVSSGTLSGSISNYGVMTITDGIIGGRIMNSGTLTMKGGAIRGNTAIANGGAISNSGMLTITGGIISGNTAGGYGGGIYNTGTLEIFGGTITGNKANMGSGVYVASGSITIGGTAKIKGNTLTSSTSTASNLYLPAGRISFGKDDLAPTSGMSVGVSVGSTDDPPILSDSYSSALDYSGYFFSDSGLGVSNVPADEWNHVLAIGTFKFTKASTDGSFELALPSDKSGYIVVARYNEFGQFIKASFTSIDRGTSSGTASLPSGTGGVLRFFLVDATGYMSLLNSVVATAD